MRWLLAVTIPMRHVSIAGGGGEGEPLAQRVLWRINMFETHDQAQLPSPFFVLEEGARRWSYISQTANDEWFYVTYETACEEGLSQQQFMIPKVQFLLALASKDTPANFINEVQLVSPPWLNQKGKWLMEPIRKIQKVDERVCFELMDGQVYPSKLLGQTRVSLWSTRAKGSE